jgi:transposase
MNKEIERDLGEQPLAKIMAEHGFKSNDLVNSSTEQITHKMVSRAAKGRRLNLKIQYRILNALNKAAGKQYTLKDFFSY